MKVNFKNLMLLVTGLLLLSSCSDDDNSFKNEKVSAVKALYSPSDSDSFNLQNKGSTVFEWEAAKAEDDGVILYDVVFDKENGDFSKPVYVTTSDGKGFQNTLNITYKDLNKIADMAGIGSASAGKLKWTIRTSKGLKTQNSDVANTFEVIRPSGFPVPDQLFLTGSATETGANLADAREFKKTGQSTYEIYTHLKNGKYQLVSGNNGSPDSFYIQKNKLKQSGETDFDGDEGVYRLRVDFSNGEVDIAKINKVELWYPSYDAFKFELNYTNNGIWQVENQYIEFKQESYGRDERYKFRFKVENSNGEVSDEWYGSTNADNNKPTADTPASYFYMVPVSSNAFDNTFKFAADVDKSNANIQIFFNKDVPEYTHKVTVL